MKKIKLLTLLLLVSLNLFAQNDGLYTYGTSNTESASAIIKLSDNTYVIGARNSNNNFTLLNVNDNGTVIKQSTLPNTMTITKLLLLSNNDILIVGSETTPENSSIIVIRMTSNFGLIWSKKISTSNIVYAYSAIECTGGDIMMVGYSSISGTGNTDWDAMAIRLFSNGTLRWKKIISTSFNSDWFVDLVELPSKNVIVVGASAQPSIDYLMCKISENGNVSNITTFDAGQNEVMYSPLFINSKLYVTAGSWSFAFGQYDVSLVKLDTNFNIELSRAFGGSGMDFPLYSQYANNEIHIFGYTNTFDSDYDLFLTSISLTGTITRTKKIGGTARELVSTKSNSFLISPTGKFIIAGETASYGSGSTDIFMSITDGISNCCSFISDVSYNSADVSYTSNNSIVPDINTTLNSISNFSITPSTTVSLSPTTNCTTTSINSTIVADSVVCVNNSLSFTVNTNSVGSTFSWNFGDPSSGGNNLSNLQNTNHVFTNSGLYTVIVTTTNGCATTKDTIIVRVTNTASLNLLIETNNTTYCSNEPISFVSNNINSGNVYSWNFDDPSSGSNNVSSNASAMHIFSNAGVYDVMLIVNNGCSSDTDTVQITILNNVLLNTQISLPSLTYCLGDTVRFNFITNDNSAIYEWKIFSNNSLDSTLHLKSFNMVFNANGTYNVYLITNNNCNSDTDSVNITITNSVDVTIQTNKLLYCKDEEAHFSYQIIGTANTILWDFGDPASGSNNTSNLLTPKHIYQNAGKYTVQLIVSGACLSDTDTLSIYVSEGIDLQTQISNIPRNYCKGEAININALSADPAANFSWDFGDPLSGTANSSTLPNPQHIFNQNGNYVITLLSGNLCKQEYDTIHISIAPSITPSFEFLIDSCSGVSSFINTTNNKTNYNFNWLVNNQSISVDENAIFTFPNEGDFNISLIINPNENCVDTFTQQINYLSLNDSSNLLIPNVFTPNDDGINDFYTVKGSTLCKVKKMIVFNRWGKKLFETDSIFQWDGRTNNEYCPVGTYIVYLELENKKLVRTVSLLK